MFRLPHPVFASLLVFGLICRAADQYNDFEDPPFNYNSAKMRDPFTLLQEKVSSGAVKLPGGSPGIFLKGLLYELDIPAESQALVYSKTSFQRRVIRPDNLRAMYFNDEVFLTYIPGGRIEVASTDPVLGSVFSIFDPTGGPGLPPIESPDACIGCHGGSFTNFLPGPMLRSVLPDSEGRVYRSTRENPSGHGVPYHDRWGGWVVTGAPKGFQHLGNTMVVTQNGKPETVPGPFMEPGWLEKYAKEKELPFAESDLVALLTLDHQVGCLNKIVEANYRWRNAVFQMNQRQEKAGEPLTSMLEGRDLREFVEWIDVLLTQILFANEPKWEAEPADPAKSKFAQVFSKRGRQTKSGASLREFDLKSRLFKNRCSYLLEGSSFNALPLEARHLIFRRLGEILTSQKPVEGFTHLEAEEKQRIHAILKETRDDLPENF